MARIADERNSLQVDQDGFLSRPEAWDEEVAAALAEREGIRTLNPEQMKILRFLRQYYAKNHSFPILRYVCKKVGAVSAQCLADEFTDPMKAWKIAGLPKPPQVFFTSFDGKKYFANPFY